MPLKFLRLHSALEQEVSPGLPGPDPAGPGKSVASGRPPEATAGDTAVLPGGGKEGAPAPVHLCSRSGSLPPERARGRLGRTLPPPAVKATEHH